MSGLKLEIRRDKAFRVINSAGRTLDLRHATGRIEEAQMVPRDNSRSSSQLSRAA